MTAALRSDEYRVEVEVDGERRWEFRGASSRTSAAMGPYPENDQEVRARVARDAGEVARRKAHQESPEGKAEVARRARTQEALALYFPRPVHHGRAGATLGSFTITGPDEYLCTAFIFPLQDARARLAEARRPAADAREAARAAKAAIPIAATSGLPSNASLEDIRAARVRFDEAVAHVADLEAQAVLLEDAIDSALEIEVRRLDRLADGAVEARRRGELRAPILESMRFVWRDEDSALLAHLLHVHMDPASAIYAAIYAASGTPMPSLRSLWTLARLATAERSFDDDQCVGQDRNRGRWLVESHDFQRALSQALHSSLFVRFKLDPEEGHRIQKRDASWGPKPAMGSMVGGRAV